MSTLNEIEFEKYKQKGAYHWQRISYHPLERNAHVLARYRNMIKLMESSGGDPKGKRVLDVGCGDGVLSYLIAKEGASVSGVDYSDIAIRFANEKTASLAIDFRQASAYELPYDDNQFDGVVSSDVIEHLADVSSYLDEMHRVTKPGGHIIISTPIRITEEPLDKMHVVEWFQSEFKDIIEAKWANSNYHYSHPIALMELNNRYIFGRPWLRLMINLLSFVHNPFEGFDTKFRYPAMQYSVSQKSEI